MRIQLPPTRRRPAGYALLLALVFIGVSLLLMTSLLQWTSGSTLITDRNNLYHRAVGAAEAATEVALSRMAHDFAHQTFDPANLAAYRNAVPTNGWAAEYQFDNGAGAADQIWVECTPTRVFTNLASQFAGLRGWAYEGRVRANARLRTPVQPDFAVAVRQDFQLASIPIFQFGIFYGLDLEIHPYADMTVTGKVHGGADVYASPAYKLQFADAVGAVGRIYHHRHPDDPGFSSGVVPIYESLHQEKVSSLTLPIGTNHSPEAVRQILEPPPAGESPVSVLGRQRFYNRADVVVTAYLTNWTVAFNANGDGTDFAKWPLRYYSWPDTNTVFLKTNAFYDYRENKTVFSLDLDVQKFNAWAVEDSYAVALAGARGRALNSIYVKDNLSMPDRLVAVRVRNAQTLPSAGLTVATARPLYVQGHFNTTLPVKPAALAGDSLTVLSSRWRDLDNYKAGTRLDDRRADDTTVNAALLAGVVPTTSRAGTKYYSGGVHNLPRLLEDWSGKTFTFNGSLVALFPSRHATNFWRNPGDYYDPPARPWAFDANFLNKDKLPPLTPYVQKLVRSRWQVIAATEPN